MDTGRKTGAAKIIIRLVILLMLALILLFVIKDYNESNAGDLPSWLSSLVGDDKETATKISFAPDANNTFLVYQDGLAVLSSTELVLYDVSGDESLSQSTGYTRPAARSAGEFLLTYDIGGKSICYIRNKAVKTNMKLNYAILTADIGKDGWFLVTSEEFGSKATVTVYNPEMTQVYKWPSSERYITCAAIADDHSGMAFGGLSQKDARIQSSVVMLHLDSAEPYSVIEFDDELILDMDYLPDGSLAVLTESCILTVDPSGRERGRYEFDNSLFREYSFNGDGFILLRLNKNGVGETSEVLVLNYDAGLEHSVSLDNIYSISCSGKYAGVLTSDHIIVYNSSLEEQFSSSISAGSKKLLMREDGSAIVLSSSEASIYR